MTSSTDNEVTLYERLGGEAAFEAAVTRFYGRVTSDDRVASFFRGVDMRRQIAKQKAFLTFATGGPGAYTGKSLRKAHAHLERLTDLHVDVVIEHLGATLAELGVAAEDIAAVAALAETVRGDVLGR